jgi:acetyltransferase-like isoleucine patch superfamily enzyme
MLAGQLCLPQLGLCAREFVLVDCGLHRLGSCGPNVLLVELLFETNMIFKLLHAVFPLKLVERFQLVFKVAYSMWVKYEFHTCGRRCFFGTFLQLHGGKHIDIADNVTMGRHLVIEVYDKYRDQQFTPSVKIGNYVNIGDYSHLSCINGITIKDNVRMGRKVFITDNSHGASDRSLLDTRPNIRPLHSKGPITIEENAWIGEMVCIMPGVTLGRGCIVAANSVVTHDVPAYSVVAGCPAKVIKQL